MNERILEFAKQTGLCDADGDFFGGKISQYEEFAQLIVRECAEKFAAEPDRPFYGRHVSYHIKKHFGVEE